MESKNNSKKEKNISPFTKDIFDITSKTVAIFGGLISAIILIITLNNGTKQRANELRWNQAKLASELVDKTLNDPLALNALNMLDWENKSYQNGDSVIIINSDEVQRSLNIENNLNLPPNGEFIRESFDRLSYYLGKIERSLKSNLIIFDDVSSPMDYYVPFLRSKYGRVLIPYMKQLHHNDAIKFMNRFEPQPAQNATRDGS
jgi:hypothetical protein